MKTIKLNNIKKIYKKNIILNGIDYEFTPGLCYMINGANGAGKSTLLKIIMNLIYPTSGSVALNDNIIGFVPEKLIMPSYLSIYEFLSQITYIKDDNLDIIDYYLDFWSLSKDKNKKLKELSKGMLQKVLITQALLGNPDVVIFDEALNGLDKTMQNKLINIIKTLKEQNKIIIISTHYEDYYKEVVDKRLRIENGKII